MRFGGGGGESRRNSGSAMSASRTKASSAASSSAPAAPSPLDETIAGGIARAGSQSTIHPLDTVKVRMQAGTEQLTAGSVRDRAEIGRSVRSRCRYQARRVASLYRGVFGAASGAGVAIGAYFALYAWTKRAVRKIDRRRALGAGQVAFVSGAIAGAGSCVVKVPIAVCIRSVQANVFPNVARAAREIVRTAGPRGLFTGFLPTVFEDVPDMAVKFAVYESLKSIHSKVAKREASIPEDLMFGGLAGAVSAGATTPWDVVKTRMMCSAAVRPTVRGAVRSIAAEGGVAAFFTGLGPRSLSSGIHSAIFFCFYEAIRTALQEKQLRERLCALETGKASGKGKGRGKGR